jgi:type I restriction enzyme M protein
MSDTELPRLKTRAERLGRANELNNHANLIWGIAELLRGDYKQSEYGRVILPLVVMRRLDQALEHTKKDVLDKVADLERRGIEHMERPLRGAAGRQFFNRSPLTFPQLLNDPGQIAVNLRIYLDGFSSLAQQVFENFGFETQIERLERSNLLYPVVSRICDVDLHPDRIEPEDMGAIFEDLIRKFAEQSNETAGEHFTPREVVRLMVDLLLAGDDRALTDKAPIRTVYDCACGTGGMLSEAYRHITALNDNADVRLYGQELNPESYAICLADILLKDQDASRIAQGNTLSRDQHRGERFHYGIANPPFGVDWSKVEREVREEHARGEGGRFAAGLPRKSDGQLLFLLNLVAKMREVEKDGGRVAIVLNGSPLFTGAAGSGESEIRRYLVENDMLEGIVALPEQLFYNTGIATYVWVLTNRKSAEREGKVQLVDAREMWVKMRRSLGDKRRLISDEFIEELGRLYGAFDDSDDRVKIMPNEAFGYRSIVVEQPLRARWEIGPDTWAGVDQEKALDKLYSESDPPAACAALAQMPHAVYGTEKDASDAIKAALLTTLPKVPASLLKALVARSLVRDPDAEPVRDAKGRIVPDPDLRDTENVPLNEDIQTYLEREVLPHVEGAWCPDPVGKVGYEVPFTRLFYRYTPLRPSAEIKQELRELESDIRQLLDEVLV